MSAILVTGAAGFIGFHVSRRLLERGERVVGLDNLNPYYDVRLKRDRLAQLASSPSFEFIEADVAQRAAIDLAIDRTRPTSIVHMAAQAGVRYSLVNPHVYIESNLVGFLNVLEGARRHAVRHLVFASSSSVYGANTRTPFSVHDNVDHPISLYAATKKANELLAHAYSHLYAIPATGLRFFTVYGPWGRPDMSLFVFTKAILEGRPIDVYNHGQMQRDFTYIDDVADGVVRVLDRVPSPDPAWTGAAPDPSASAAPYRLYNIGNHQPIDLLHFIAVLESCLDKKAILNLLPIQPGDVPATFADIEDLARDIGFAPHTPIQHGIARFVEWYRSYYGV